MNWTLQPLIDKILRNTEPKTITHFTKLVSETIFTSKKYDNNEMQSHRIKSFCMCQSILSFKVYY